MIIQVEEFVKEASMPKRLQVEQPLDLELLHRAMHLAYLIPTSIHAATASGQATIPLVTPGGILRVRSNGAPGIVDAGDEAQNEARHQ